MGLRRTVAALARLPDRPRRDRLAVAVAGCATYAASLVATAAPLGAAVWAVGAVPVALAAWLFGARAGLAAGLLDLAIALRLSAHADLSVAVLSGLAVTALGVAIGRASEVESALRLRTEELRSSDERTRELLGHAPIVLFAVDARGTFTFEEGRGLATLGLRPGGHVGRSFFDVYADQPEAVALMRRALAGDEVSRTFQERDVAFDVRYTPIRRDGAVVGATGVAVDLSERRRAELAARSSEERFRRFFELNPVVSAITRVSDGRIVDANPSYLQTFGYTRDELVGRTTVELGMWSSTEARAAMIADLAVHGAARNVEMRAPTKAGEERVILASFDLMDLDGERYLVSSGTDITERRRAEGQLRESEDRFARLFRQNPAGLLLNRVADGVIVDVNDAWLRLTGYAREEVLGRTISQLGLWADSAARRLLTERLHREGAVRDYEFRVHVRSGDLREALASFEILDSGGERCVLTSAIDITDRKHAEQALEHRALHDDLTGLPNRVLLHDRLKQAIFVARRQRGSLALVVMDLDHFKDVNDTFGHHAGDQLLQQVGPRLRDLLRETDTVARLGGDEFALILPGASAAGAKQVSRGVLEALAEPFLVEGQSLRVEASLGIVLYPRDGDDVATLLRRADIAMYVAKRAGHTASEYSPAEDEHTPERLALLGELGAAIEKGEVVVYFHPEVSLQTGQVVGMEALARWEHPDRGLLGPSEFIPLAERTGLMKPLTDTVLRGAVESCRAWQAAGLDLRLAVNLSARSLLDAELADSVASIVESARLRPSLLALEITESVIMTDPRRALATLARLRRLGVRLAIDDFGTGYSSLGYLHEIAVHQVKIDQSFVKGMKLDRGSAAIVRATVELAHSLGFEVVAEGVEDAATCDLLAEMGCDLVQGYYVAEPMAGRDVSAWLTSYAKAPRIKAKVLA